MKKLISRVFAARGGLWCWLVACLVSHSCLGSVQAAEVDLTPVSSADGLYNSVTVAGQTAWQNTGPESWYLYGRRPDSFNFTAGQTLYGRVTYFDDAGGTIALEYDSQTHPYTVSQLHTRTTRVGSGQFVNGYFELPKVRFNKRQNANTDFRVVCAGQVPVQRITLSDTPFDDPDFQLAVARAWQNRYTGPAKDYIDRSTLKGKVMTGYQGWFNTPNDIKDADWRHWKRGSTMTPENFTIDAWPDLREYDPASLVRAAKVMTASGEPAYLFSSATYAVVRQHFRWMRKHNVDGAWLQRFHPQAGAETEWPLRNVSKAAAEEGLVWGVTYDVSGMADATVAAKLQADWEWLTTQFDILNDPRYIREAGKPVVFIWGLPVPDRNFTPASANAVADYFKAQGVYVLGGLPTNWSSLSASWQTHMAKYDGVLVWMNQNTPDATIFRNRGQDFYPHIWPGFSWAHLQKLPATPLTQYTDRAGGQFYWSKGRDWISAADSLYIGMWDEYDESTHMIPMTDDPPPPHTEWGRFINNQSKPTDWWMMLTDEIKRMMLGQRTNTNTLPTVGSLANRSNIGPEASVDLGATDLPNFLSRVQNSGDGNTIVEIVGGKECRGNLAPETTHRYLYFNVNDDFAYQLVTGDVTIEVEYYDHSLSTVLGLQYDSSSAAYTNHPQTISTTGSNTWRRVRFEIADAFFGGRQNNGADFRLNFGGSKLNVNRVWVRLPEGKIHPFTWTNASAGPPLGWSKNANWLGGIVGQSDLTSTVRILPGQTLAGGTIPISNNLTGLQLGTLNLGGTASATADTTVTLSGNAFSLGGSAPTITLDATKTGFDLTYDLAAPVTLVGTTQVSGTGNASLRISGPLSGSGGLHQTSAGTLALTGANTYTGPTIISGGTLQISGGGSLGSGNYAGAITLSNSANFEQLSGSTQSLSGAITGTGTVRNASGELILTNAGNDFSALNINAGRVFIASNAAALPAAATVNLSGGTLDFDVAGTYPSAITVASGSHLAARAATTLNHVTLPGTGTVIFNNDDVQTATLDIHSDQVLTGSLTLQVGGDRMGPTGGPLGGVNLSGTISGNGSLVVTSSGNLSNPNCGTGVLTLSGAANTYSGDTTVNSGTLRLSAAQDPLNANTGNDASTVTIAAAGATLDLAYTGTDKVAELFIGTTRLATGVYGPSATQIPQLISSSGTGTLTVANGPVAGYFTWASINGAGANLNDDHDHDGVANGVEYFIGGSTLPTANTTRFTPVPSVTTTAGVKSVTWIKAAVYTGTYGTHFWVETSATLNGDWATEPYPGGNVTLTGNDVKYTFPAGATNFARLKVARAAP